jgi:hypothetical protein
MLIYFAGSFAPKLLLAKPSTKIYKTLHEMREQWGILFSYKDVTKNTIQSFKEKERMFDNENK